MAFGTLTTLCNDETVDPAIVVRLRSANRPASYGCVHVTTVRQAARPTSDDSRYADGHRSTSLFGKQIRPRRRRIGSLAGR
jgi:hypothetical protein